MFEIIIFKPLVRSVFPFFVVGRFLEHVAGRILELKKVFYALFIITPFCHIAIGVLFGLFSHYAVFPPSFPHGSVI